MIGVTLCSRRAVEPVGPKYPTRITIRMRRLTLVSAPLCSIAIVGGFAYALISSNDDLEKMHEETVRLNCHLDPSGPEWP